ncbi:MAG: DUF1573 domain-containing protein, partial [Bergeyella zoohelcum]|nr:DUF1573 domain-containing protein [Bergeyella zoohelcum]
MKNKWLVMAVVALVFTACEKKNETPDALQDTSALTEVAESADNQVEALQSQTIQEDPNAALIAQAKSKPLTNVALSESHWDFKDVKKGESVEHIYEITNTGENPLIISEVKPACGCTAPDFTREPIMPGKKGKITLKFDSSNFDGL